MTVNLGDFANFDNIDQEMQEGGDFGAMEAHENTFLVASSESKQGNESSIYVEVVLDVVGEKYNGRKIWMNYYLVKKDGTENKVARSEYGRLCNACGVTDPKAMLDPKNLLSKMISGTVKVVKSQGYEDKNEVKNPKAIGGTAAPAQGAVGNSPAQQGANPFQNKS
jgi:hypothetical protein